MDCDVSQCCAGCVCTSSLPLIAFCLFTYRITRRPGGRRSEARCWASSTEACQRGARSRWPSFGGQTRSLLHAASGLSCGATLLLNSAGPCKPQRLSPQTRQHGTAAGAHATVFACVHSQLTQVSHCFLRPLTFKILHMSYSRANGCEHRLMHFHHADAASCASCARQIIADAPGTWRSDHACNAPRLGSCAE